jgi:transposase-like protein
MSVLTTAHFHNEEAAFAKLESILWPEGPVCPHCGGVDRIYTLKGVRTKPSKKHPEGVERPGLKKCGHCRKQFTVRVGTIFEDSHAPLHKWFQAIHLLCASKKGISSPQLHRVLEITYEAAWFMSHRIREAMRSGSLAPMGGGGGIVEIDETFIGQRADAPVAAGFRHKHAVLTLVDRKGEARSFHIDRADMRNIMPIVRENLAAEAKVVTDDAGYYYHMDREYEHAFVVHSEGQYGRGDIHTNTIEGFFSIFKRGMKGVYQTAQRSICTATLPSSISVTATARCSVLKIRNALSRRSRAPKASG